MRGERGTYSTGAATVTGSSPRARGTGRPAIPGRHEQRFIPACAGNGGTRVSRGAGRAVHPRVRGERSMTAFLASSSGGSSPRARGTDSRHRCAPGGGRFIPACAGNGTRSRVSAGTISVHPRVRGERPVASTAAWLKAGSSPRARGTAGSSGQAWPPPRFIPACAGNGRWCPRRCSARAVHPRVRGERALVGIPVAVATGSSPRARGTDRPPAAGQSEPRFIPACAGNGPHPKKECPSPSVHPRVRGERL